MVPEEVISKIEKLLALSQSANENEAKLAMEKATELLVRYNLSIEQLGNSQEKKYTEESVNLGVKQPIYDAMIRTILEEYFFVRVFGSPAYLLELRYWKLTICGTPTNVKVAGYVHDFLHRKFPELWNAYKIENLKSDKVSMNSYYTGLYKGLREQLDSTKKKVETSMDLMVVKDKALVKWMLEHHENLKAYSSSGVRVDRDSEAYASGIAHGKEIRITKAMSSSQSYRNNQLGG